MSRVIRTIDAFYEVGTLGVPKFQAEHVYGEAADLIAKHVGAAITVSAVKGVRIPLEGDTLGITQIRLPSANPHTALLTGRRVGAGSEFGRGGIAQVSTRNSHTEASKIVVSINPRANDPTGGDKIVDTARAIGTTFGLGDCAVPSCIMYPALADSKGGLNPQLISGKPFCDPCAEQLEIAGYQELAVSL